METSHFDNAQQAITRRGYVPGEQKGRVAVMTEETSANWRDNASPQAQADLDELLSASLGAALEHLGKRGEFYPFAMSIDGVIDPSNTKAAPVDVDIVFADPAVLGDKPEAEAVIEELRRILHTRATNDTRTIPQRASAIVLQAIVQGFGDVVRVDLEHAEGVQLMVVAPLETSGKSRKRQYDFGDLRLLPGQRHVW